MEFFDIWVLQCLINGYAFVGVEGQQFFEQVDGLFRTLALLLLEPGLSSLAHAFEECLRQCRIDSLDVLLGGVADGSYDLLDLVERTSAREDGFADDQFAQYAARTPHVHSLRLDGGAQQDFGRALPARGDLVGEDRRLVVVVLLGHAARQAEVGHLHVAFRVEQ